MPPLIVASRKSPLAVAQTRAAVSALEESGFPCRIKTFSTVGDEIADKPLADIGGKELFVNNLRRALKNGDADIAAHSFKDMPARPSPMFANLAVGFGEDPRDVFLSSRFDSLRAMPQGATVGTCSPRRAALLMEYFPKIKTVPMRGNVQTRLQKMRDGACDGIILAAAGLLRLNLLNGDANCLNSETDICVEWLPPDIFIPAPGQGLLALECLAKRIGGGGDLQSVCAALSNKTAAPRADIESEFSRAIGGDCQTPLGAHAVLENGEVCVRLFHAVGGRFCKTIVRAADNKGAKAAVRRAAKTLTAQQ